jgi:hypothetical protein
MISLPVYARLVIFKLLRVERENRIFHLTLFKSESPYKAIFQCLIVLRHVFTSIFHRFDRLWMRILWECAGGNAI